MSGPARDLERRIDGLESGEDVDAPYIRRSAVGNKPGLRDRVGCLYLQCLIIEVCVLKEILLNGWRWIGRAACWLYRRGR